MWTLAQDAPAAIDDHVHVIPGMFLLPYGVTAAVPLVTACWPFRYDTLQDFLKHVHGLVPEWAQVKCAAAYALAKLPIPSCARC